MNLLRDDDEERLARIEQILENLRRELAPFSVAHKEGVVEARLTRERVQSVRTELRATIQQSKAVGRQIAARKKPKKS